MPRTARRFRARWLSGLRRGAGGASEPRPPRYGAQPTPRSATVQEAQPTRRPREGPGPHRGSGSGPQPRTRKCNRGWEGEGSEGTQVAKRKRARTRSRGQEGERCAGPQPGSGCVSGAGDRNRVRDARARRGAATKVVKRKRGAEAQPRPARASEPRDRNHRTVGVWGVAPQVSTRAGQACALRRQGSPPASPRSGSNRRPPVYKTGALAS
jgi:hypothetical protein